MSYKVTWLEVMTVCFSLGILYHYLVRDIKVYKRKTGYNKLKKYVERTEKGINEISN